ncbi:exosome 3'-_5 exonuclease subunit ski4 (Csl4), partial [Cryomyces antarcticus]
MALPALALPGQPLGPTSKYTPGPGTHVQSAQIIASICGPVLTSRPLPSSSTSAAGSKPSKTTPLPLEVLSVSRTPLPASTTAASTVGAASAAETSNVLPEVNNIVLARVVRVMARQATVEILVVGDGVVREAFQGVVRVQDIRATEKDKVRVGESFRVGDVVRGIV